MCIGGVHQHSACNCQMQECSNDSSGARVQTPPSHRNAPVLSSLASSPLPGAVRAAATASRSAMEWPIEVVECGKPALALRSLCGINRSAVV